MSMLESLAALLTDMGFAQLSLLFVVVAAYSLAINGGLSSTLRSGAASLAFVAGAAFAAVTPSWVSGVAFLALVVVGVAAFAAGAWIVSALLGLNAEAGSAGLADESGEVHAPALQPGRAFAPISAFGPL